MAEDLTIRRMVPEDAEPGSWTAPDGWPIHMLRLPPKGVRKGALLFAGGRADFIEKYLESLIHWRESGWEVTAFDWRGQGGSGRAPGLSTNLGHVDDFAGWIADLAGLAAHWRAAIAGPHVLVGHSMGGHLMLRYVAEGAPRPAALVLSSPMIGFRAPLPERIVRAIAAAHLRRGRAARFAWGQSGKPRAANVLRQRRLTGDSSRYSDELWWHQAKPDYYLGGVSWGWIDAAWRSTDRLEMPGMVETITTPTLLVAAAGDRVVDTPRAVALVGRIADHEIALFDGGHELLRERDDIRCAAWRRIDRFLEERVQC